MKNLGSKLTFSDAGGAKAVSLESERVLLKDLAWFDFGKLPMICQAGFTHRTFLGAPGREETVPTDLVKLHSECCYTHK